MNGLAERLRRSFAANPDIDAEPFLHYAELAGDAAQLIRAAVLVPIIDATIPRVLLTVRDAGLRSHAGQVAFPGGRIDPEDDGPVGAALREACAAAHSAGTPPSCGCHRSPQHNRRPPRPGESP